MIPQRVTLENFLSFGEKQEIVFNSDDVLWVIGGPNGSGKSAVFDAMTYCLFGTHRASGMQIKGKDRHLIRHGENGFSIAFEFEFNGKYYRITRGRTKGTRQPTPTVEQRESDSTWERVPSVNNVDQLDKWVIRTLGLNSDQFQASVLLRQGKADAFVDAKPAMRFEILKGIINLEQYEKLAKCVGERSAEAARAAKASQKQLEDKHPVTPEQLAQAEHEAQETEQKRLQCEEALQHATTNKERAAQWNKWQTDRAQTVGRIQKAKELRDQSEQIEKNHVRWKYLSETLPRLNSMIDLRARLERKTLEVTNDQAAINEQEQQWRQHSTSVQQLTEELQQLQTNKNELEQRLNQLATQGKDLASRLKASQELTTLQKEVNSYPVTLEQDVSAAKESYNQAIDSQAKAKDEVIRLKTILKQAEEHHVKISKLKGGVNCSACGQPVTADHAEKERQHAATALTQAKQAHVAAEQTLIKAEQEAKRLSTALDKHQFRLTQKARAMDKLDTTRRNYQDLGELEPAGVLETKVNEAREQYKTEQHALDTIKQRVSTIEPEQKKGNAVLQSFERKILEQTKRIQSLEKEAAGLQGQLSTALEHLPEQLRLSTRADADRLDVELHALSERKVEQQFQQLTLSRNESALLQAQLEMIDNDLSNVPHPARVSNDEATKQFKQAGADKTAAVLNWQTARDQHQNLQRQSNEYHALVQQTARLEHQAALLKLLDEKLGRRGLQLAMMSDAQNQIVAMASQTLLQLSNHELSLELQPPDEGDAAEQALDLCIRNTENSHLTPMEYLSGSQKFRVAIAIALAIGRYSAGQSRPLESVIIDEGFGSLDREGLNAMAEELHALQRSQLLRRIILVSHQEEFADRFPVAYHLTPAEKGTCVELRRGYDA
jgi:DNA repair exonuclease SbcCD ATPase subunit